MAKTQIIFCSTDNTHQSNKQRIIHPEVINLSSTCLTDTQVRVLSKGLKFTDFLTKFSFSTSNFYGLPKVHKSKIIQEAIQVQNSEYIKINEPSDLTLRPIVAGPNCPTRSLNNLVDILLKPFIIHIKIYIKDNLDFLAKCSRENKRDTILTTFDVVGLYSNILHEYGLEAIEYWLDKFPESLHPRFTKEFVFENVRFILENNNLNFDNEYFNYANLTMGFFELPFYDLCRDKFGENLGNFIFEN